ncbi:MAG: cytochrome c oxidase assembly protein [Chloroflexota bacterium]
MPPDLWARWDLEPSIIVGIALLSAGYAYANGPFRRRHELGPPASRKQIAFFVAAQITLIVALLSPLDELGDTYLFSAHMLQHLLLATLWPPLMLLSIPEWLARRFWRGWVAAVGATITLPLFALAAFNLDIYLWHVPTLYDLTLTNGNVHILEHLSFMAFGLLNWWPILSPILEQRLSAPLQVLYLFLDGMLMMALGIVFTFIPVVLYTPYLSAPRLWGISAISDQQIGGLIMWYPGNVPYFIWLVLGFYKWIDSGEADPELYFAESPTIEPAHEPIPGVDPR